MSEKAKLIEQMIAMQSEMTAFEQKNGIDMKDFYVSDKGHLLNDYVTKYDALADKLNAMAHEEKGSKRFF